jgi:hypothetical protein
MYSIVIYIFFASCTGPGPHAVQRGPHLNNGEHEEGAREATLGSLEALQGNGIIYYIT